MLKVQPKYLKRYAQIAGLLVKYGRRDLADQLKVEGVPIECEENDAQDPADLARDLEEMGPTFVKLGQLLSTRADLLPPAYLDALKNLQDDVTPVAFEEIQDLIEHELGAKVSNIFESFDKEPIAAASMAQVHRATLRSGVGVAVKVLRPEIREQVNIDIEAITRIAKVLDKNAKFARKYDLLGIAESLELTIQRELDLRIELKSTQQIGAMIEEYPDLIAPRVYEDYSSASVLTMEYISGAKVTDVSPAVLIDLDRGGLADQLFDAYLKQVLVEGHFHADPHPGNIMLTHDRKLAIIDCGMVVHVGPQTRGHMINLLFAISEGRGEDAGREAEKLGRKMVHFDSEGFRHELTQIISEHQNDTVHRMPVGQVLMSMQSAAGTNGLRIQHEIRMLGKTLLHLDRIIEVLDPNFSPAEALKKKSSSVVQRHALEDISFNQLFRSVLETTDLLQHLPHRINRFTELLSENKIEIKADAVDEEHLVQGLQHIANRITVGVMLAALVVASALMMRIEADWTLWGYPGIAMILLIFAALSSVALILRIMFSGYRRT